MLVRASVESYLVLPSRRPRGDESARGIPLDVSDTVVVGCVHVLQVGSQVLVRLGLLALKVQIEKVEVGALLVADGSNHYESSLRRPVDGVAVLLVQRAQVLEVAGELTLGLLGAEESDGSLRGNGSRARGFGGGNNGKSISLRLPGKVNDCVLDGINDFHGNTLLLDAEDLQRRGL